MTTLQGLPPAHDIRTVAPPCPIPIRRVRLLLLRVARPFEVTGTSGVATVLLVDDDPNILRPLQFLVEREGYRVITALDGKRALASAALESPELIVTDWMMPNVDGVELCRRLKSDPVTAAIPVVMLSAALPPAPLEPLWDVLLRKPVPIAALMKAIHDLLD